MIIFTQRITEPVLWKSVIRRFGHGPRHNISHPSITSVFVLNMVVVCTTSQDHSTHQHSKEPCVKHFTNPHKRQTLVIEHEIYEDKG